MDKIPGCGNWRIRYRIIEEGQGSESADKAVGGRGVRILRAETPDRKGILPEELQGLPVWEIADHALSGDPWDTEGVTGAFDVELTDGRRLSQETQWGNRGMEFLRLPDSLREVGDYAFLNCRNLTGVEMTDREVQWGRACFMNCRRLHDIHLRRDRMEEDRGIMAYFAGETTGELEVRVTAADREARLLFPDYVEIYTENNEARQFDYTIEGAGYPYRHVFRDRKLNWHDYDSLWQTYLGREEDKARAARMAWYRLRCPAGLSPEHAREYKAFVKQHFRELAAHILTREEGRDLAHLVELAAPDKARLAEAAALARSLGRTDCLAVLMEKEHQQEAAPSGRRKTYQL